MTKAKLLEKMKVKMLAFLEERKGDPFENDSEYMQYEYKRAVEHIDAIKKTTIIDPIFEAMEGWDVPSAIMFVVKAAVSDPESLEGEGADIPLSWDT